MDRFFRRTESYIFLAIVIFSILITIINPNFFSLENLFDLLKSYSFVGILAAGVLMVIISGGIDISFMAVATVAEYLTVLFITRFGGSMFTAFLAAGLIGALMGVVNALLIHSFNIPTVIATIATMNIFYGFLIMATGGKWIYALPECFRDFAGIRVFTITNANGSQYGLSIITVLWFAVLLASALILRYTTIGRSLYAIGGCGIDKSPARRAGLNILKTQVFVYAYMGLLAGMAGIVQALLVQTVAPNSMVGKELNVIAAVVLGGASIAGGSGTVLGAVLGVALLAILNNGLTLMRVPSYWYDVLIGAVIILSVAVGALQGKRKKRKAIEIEEKAA
jgi:simple sugar transport system permease protein